MSIPQSLQHVPLNTMSAWVLTLLAAKSVRRAILLMGHPYQRNRATAARMGLLEACALFVENCYQTQTANTADGQTLIAGARASASECIDQGVTWQ